MKPILNVIFCANFPLYRTGVLSTATGLLAHMPNVSLRLYSNQKFTLLGYEMIPLEALECDIKQQYLIFSHVESSTLKELVVKIPHAFIHVGDWPVIAWRRTLSNGNIIKASLGILRFYYRIRNLSKLLKFIFVNDEDTVSAIKYGFVNSLTVPIGVNAPNVSINNTINFNKICFSGNFNFPPNLDAAKILLLWARDNLNYSVMLVGYGAGLLHNLISSPNVFLHDSVSSIVDFLAIQRPIYVSLLRFGAGSKNKILEAMISGCPVIATPESLEPYFDGFNSIITIKNVKELGIALEQIAANHEISQKVEQSFIKIMNERSWKNASNMLLDAIHG
ncbi:MAG: glycosyltransferase [Burkholderiales bacterium]|nr:glycosyltransferase [Burkholderiales bacterium]